MAGPLLVLSVLFAAAPRLCATYPLVRNFSRTQYSAGRQNWSVAQDKLGRMLFGNSDCLLVTDSRHWYQYFLSNYSTVRSLLLDGTDGVYAGGSEEFGVFRTSPAGELQYHSLMGTMGSRRPGAIGEIWHIHKAGSNILFQGDHHIFRYNGVDTEVFAAPAKIATSSVIKGNLYVAIEGMGLFYFKNGKFEEAPGNDRLAGMRIVSLLPMSHNVLVVTAFHGLFLLDGNNLRPYATPIDAFLKENQVFCAAANGDVYAFGTVNCGVAVLDRASGEVAYANMDTGMQNNTVLSLFFDSGNNLWAGLDNGIDYIQYNTPLSNLNGVFNVYGAGYASLLHDNTLWLGTNQGLYSTPYPLPDLARPESVRRVLSGQVWNLDEVEGTMFACCDAGLYYRAGAGFRVVDGVPGTWKVIPVPDEVVRQYAPAAQSSYLLASTYDGFYLLQRTGAGWQSVGRVSGYDDIGGRFSIDKYGDIWLSHWMKGVYRLRLDVADCRFVSSSFYDTSHGLPTNRDNFVNILDGEPVIATEGGFSRFNRSTGRIEPDTVLSGIFGFLPSMHLYGNKTNGILAVNLKTIRTANLDASGKYRVDSLTFAPIADKLIPGHDNFNFLSPRHIIVSNQDGFYDVNLDRQSDSIPSASTFVSRVYAGMDSLVYQASAGVALDGGLLLPFSLNSLRFEFVTPEYNYPDCVTYSYKLENYDTEWSPWTTSNSKEYTRLREGDYKLLVRSHNNYTGRDTMSEFRLTIAPPWYRSIWARIVYCMAVGVLVWFFIRTMKRSSARQARRIEERKEKELETMRRTAREETLRKDYEIAALKSQQLEHDIRHKSEEISNITMNVVRKNEILLDIADRLTKIQEHQEVKAHRTPDVQRQLAKIQGVIRDNIGQDDHWKDFTNSFDQAYDNYTQKLRSMHSELSEGDLRICCYLRMGLSSKEIAPLLNISYRSVEMSRYRIRKKMGLTRDQNLTEYLQRL